MQGKNYLFQFTKFKCNNRKPIIQIQIQLLIRLISVKFCYVCMIVANIMVTQMEDDGPSAERRENSGMKKTKMCIFRL